MPQILKKLIPSTMLAILIMIQLPMNMLAATSGESNTITATGKATAYLDDNQNSDGGIDGYGGETEWTVVAVKAKGLEPEEFKNDTGKSLVDYLENNVTPDSASATDIERRIIAIAASGEDSKNFKGTDYNAKLLDKHNNNQIGEENLLNDDIFGVIAINASQDSNLKPIAQDAYDYFMSHQQTDGGFSWTTDSCDLYCGTDSNDTAAAIIAMYSAENMKLNNSDLSETQLKKEKAIVFLLKTQNADGGFGYDVASLSDGSSTAWALMALNIVGESVLDEANNARCWLLANQNADGGFGYNSVSGSDTYTTAHAVTALTGTNWLLAPAASSGDGIISCEEPIASSSSSKVTPKPDKKSAELSHQTERGSVLSATTSNENKTNNNAGTGGNIGGGAASTQANPAKSGPNYSLYGLAFLGLIAIGWFVIQSRQKQGI